MSGGFADLHLHTTASDGLDSLATMVRRARAAGLTAIAITDHDAITTELDGRVTTLQSVEVITGVELKADFGHVSGELLGYFVDPKAPRLRELLARMERARESRMRDMIEKCCDAGLGIEMSDVRRHAAGNLGRPHLARALVEAGAVRHTDEAFQRHIGRGKPCYVPVEKPSLREAVDVLRSAGGAVSVAHPCLMRIADWDRFLKDLADGGVNALELVYPYEAAKSELRISPHLLAAKAAGRGFLTTGGSDDHGAGSNKTTLGLVRLAYEHVEALRAAVPVPL